MSRHKEFKAARQGCLNDRFLAGAIGEDAVKRVRADTRAAHTARQEAAKNFIFTDRVRTPEGLEGTVMFSNRRSGSVDVKLRSGHTRPYAADALKKIV